MKSLQCPELSPGWRQIVLGVIATLLALVTKQGVKTKERDITNIDNTGVIKGVKPEEVGHEVLDCQFWVDW